jgi:1-acyl-sn-glycerol-3-phosphate acyltransferase
VTGMATAKRWVGKTWLQVFGWKLEGGAPAPAKYVLIAAPHTSGWDLPFMLAAAWVMDISISWMGKRELFAPPYGWFMRGLGGIPIDRRKHENTVRWAISELDRAERLVLAVPAKGTRARAEYWKSGFYYIAKGANVPVALSYLDYGKKRCGIGPLIVPSGDVRADMDRIRKFYADVTGKYPDLEGPPRLREEDQVESESEPPALDTPVEIAIAASAAPIPAASVSAGPT